MKITSLIAISAIISLPLSSSMAQLTCEDLNFECPDMSTINSCSADGWGHNMTLCTPDLRKWIVLSVTNNAVVKVKNAIFEPIKCEPYRPIPKGPQIYYLVTCTGQGINVGPMGPDQSEVTFQLQTSINGEKCVSYDKCM